MRWKRDTKTEHLVLKDVSTGTAVALIIQALPEKHVVHHASLDKQTTGEYLAGKYFPVLLRGSPTFFNSCEQLSMAKAIVENYLGCRDCCGTDLE